MKELVVVSGKGGTGKTSIVASFAALAHGGGLASAGDGGVVLADCDVDAADLHLVLAPACAAEAASSRRRPEVKRREEFRAGHVARIRREKCTGCGTCLAYCRFDAVRHSRSADGEETFEIDEMACEGCGVCVRFCPEDAMDFPEKVSGEWYVSATRHGPMVHARLGPAGQNSGKLVTRIRQEARKIAEEDGRRLVIADGSPGTGCTVIASITGADLALVVTEPTASGFRDFARVAQLAAKLRVPAAACVNKSDINPGVAAAIGDAAAGGGVAVLGRVPYDGDVTKAQIEGKSVVEFSDGPASAAIRQLWRATTRMIWKGMRMRFAVPTAQGKLALHFGHCESFTLVDVAEGEVIGCGDVPSPEHRPGMLPRWLDERGVDVVIAGGMGRRALELFAERGIEVAVGAPPEEPEALVKSYLAGTLETGGNVCDH